MEIFDGYARGWMDLVMNVTDNFDKHLIMRGARSVGPPNTVWEWGGGGEEEKVVIGLTCHLEQ